LIVTIIGTKGKINDEKRKEIEKKSIPTLREKNVQLIVEKDLLGKEEI